MPRRGRLRRAQAHAPAFATSILSEPAPTLTSTCYSFVSDNLVIHVASVHKYDIRERTMRAVPGAGGLSPAMNGEEVRYAYDWVRNIWANALA
jgi:hypothetical protein